MTTPHPPCTWTRCPADRLGEHGYTSTTLRSDIAPHYLALYEAVKARGGLLTSSGGRRALPVAAGPGRAKTSLHYIGRAHDLYPYSGAFDPAHDPYLVQLEDGGSWRVLARVVDETAPLAHTVPETITKVLRVVQGTAGGKRWNKQAWVPATARVFDLTALARVHGWTGIKAHKSFINGGSYAGAEWWHLEHRAGLLPTLRDELRLLYTDEEIERQFPHKEVLDQAIP